jgi:hypothetical protein
MYITLFFSDILELALVLLKMDILFPIIFDHARCGVRCFKNKFAKDAERIRIEQARRLFTCLEYDDA